MDDNGCLSLKLNETGEVLAPPEPRNYNEISALQTDSRTIIVDSCSHALLLELAIPWLPERKARVAIPYALEDKLAQPVEEVHFAFDKLRYQNNQYLIAAISKQRMHDVIQLLKDHRINFDAITIDWFALNSDEVAISDSDLMINKSEFKGQLSGELAKSYLNKLTSDTIYSFNDSQIQSPIPSKAEEMLSTVWIAKRLLVTKPMNFCQGDMQQGTDSKWIKNGYLIAAGLCCTWLVSLLVVDGFTLYRLNKQTQIIDQQIEVIYREFFPDAKQIISPKFRISQLLGNNSSDNQAHFWYVLNQFSHAMKNSKIDIEQLRYQNKKLSVTLISPDFAKLQDIENQLKRLKLTVKQTQASTKDKQVIATLELM